MNKTANLGDLPNEALRYLLGTYRQAAAAGVVSFSVDANTNDVEIDTAFGYFINGVKYIAAVDAAIDISAEISSLPDALPDGYTCVYVFEIDASGNYTVAAGEQILTADITAGTRSADCPAPSSADVCPFGAIKVVNASGSDFTLGTTDMSGVSGLTATLYEICRVPASL